MFFSSAISSLNSNLALDKVKFFKVVNITSYGSSLDERIKGCIDNMENDNALHIGCLYTGTTFYAFIQKYTNSNYASAICFGYSFTKPRYYVKREGAWLTPIDL